MQSRRGSGTGRADVRSIVQNGSSPPRCRDCVSALNRWTCEVRKSAASALDALYLFLCAGTGPRATVHSDLRADAQHLLDRIAPAATSRRWRASFIRARARHTNRRTFLLREDPDTHAEAGDWRMRQPCAAMMSRRAVLWPQCDAGFLSRKVRWQTISSGATNSGSARLCRNPIRSRRDSRCGS